MPLRIVLGVMPYTGTRPYQAGSPLAFALRAPLGMTTLVPPMSLGSRGCCAASRAGRGFSANGLSHRVRCGPHVRFTSAQAPHSQES
jgi:hypothetical protein